MKRLKNLWTAACRRPFRAFYALGVCLLALTLAGNFALDQLLYAAGALKEKTVTLENTEQYTLVNMECTGDGLVSTTGDAQLLLNPGTLQPMTLQELSGVFCQELARQELDDTTPYIDCHRLAVPLIVATNAPIVSRLFCTRYIDSRTVATMIRAYNRSRMHRVPLIFRLKRFRFFVTSPVAFS